MTACKVCKRISCDDDCEELQEIYRQQQREKLRDIDPDEIDCEVCGQTYGEATHEDCHGDSA